MLSGLPRWSSRNGAQNAVLMLLVLARRTAQRNVPEGIDGGGVGEQVGQPQEERRHGGGLTATDPSEEQEDNLQRQAQEHKDLGRPLIPNVQRPSSCSHYCCIFFILSFFLFQDPQISCKKLKYIINTLMRTTYVDYRRCILYDPIHVQTK